MDKPREVRLALKGTPTSIKPMFADEVMVSVGMKAVKDEKGKIKKEGVVRIGFIDMVRGQLLGEFILTPITANAFLRVLSANLKKLDEELKSEKLPEKPIIKEEGTISYIG
jgi:hypothetical protein